MMNHRLSYKIIFLLAAFTMEAGAQAFYQPGTVRAGKNLHAPLDPPEQHDVDHFWQVEPEIKLHHFGLGEGKNIVVVHGGPGFPPDSPWPGIVPLKKEYRIHFYDQRGCGESTRSVDKFASPNYFQNMTDLDKALGLGAHIADIERIRRILGVEKLILIGHSYGGFISSLYAVEFPEHVEALVLVAPADTLVWPPKGDSLFDVVGQCLPKGKGEEFKTFLKDYLDYGKIFSRSEADLIGMNQRLASYIMAAYEEKGIFTNTGTKREGIGGWVSHAVYFSTGFRYDYRDTLKNMAAPALVIHGAKDLQPEKASRAYADGFPNARFEVMAGSSHFPYSEEPEEFSRLIKGFLAKEKPQGEKGG
ncbi:MAG: alpha/beta hydrolase [Planctomycetota bacterium]